ncbi:MAG: hypothetical protein JWP12_694 [Bacteroidetes bacterium]|nr:hypothetical protein [Bacteroidota bacterium]
MGKNTLKNVIAGALLTTLGSATFAQGLESVIVEKYYVADAADAAGSVGTLAVGSVTYRVYVDLLPGYKFEALYGVPGHTMTINTTTTFFNNEDRGATTPSYTKAQAAGNTVMLDSWFSAGAAASNQMGILKSEDDGAANQTNADGILQNTDPQAGIPLTTQDGFIAGTPQSVTFVGLSTTDLNVFDATSAVGNSFSTSNGSIACLVGSTGPVPATNKVLVGQFTTDGTFTFALNIQIGTPSGGTENYVATSPASGEISIPSLIYNSSVGVSVADIKSNESNFILYPNPATDVVKMDITSTNKITNNSYKIVNLLGDVVMQKTIGEVSGTTTEVIDLSSLSTGLYFVELNLNGKITTKKIIKK